MTKENLLSLLTSDIDDHYFPEQFIEECQYTHTTSKYEFQSP